jgi:hypothetical protein
MDQLPSSSLNLRGILRSSHALLGLLAVCAGALFAVSLWAGFDFGKYLFSAIFFVLFVCVIVRYCVKGPEADRSQPTISVTHQDNRLQAHIVNIDSTAEILSILQAVSRRRPLPPPVAIIQGSATDLNAQRSLTPEQAKQLQESDSQLLLSSNPPTPLAQVPQREV